MAVDYSSQYRTEQLEPFFPNELIKMFVSMIVTLAIIVALALVLPEHEGQPANPSSTPVSIKPEWYFLAVYEALKLMPRTLLGIPGELVCVLGQGAVFLVLLSLPFWYRRGRERRPEPAYLVAVTGVIVIFVALTILGFWPENEAGEAVPLGEYLHAHPVFLSLIPLGIIFGYGMLLWEVRTIRRRWGR